MLTVMKTLYCLHPLPLRSFESIGVANIKITLVISSHTILSSQYRAVAAIICFHMIIKLIHFDLKKQLFVFCIIDQF